MSADLGTARAKVVLDTSQLAAGVSAATAQFGQLEGSTQGLSSALSGVASTFGVIGAALTVGLGAALHTFGDFEAQMNTLGAVSGATADQMTQLGDLAQQIGADTTLGASQAADALTELSKAGVDTQDILEGAGEAAATLALAGGVGVADAARTMANAMNVFGIAGTKAGHVADVFANAANKSAADVDQLSQALAQVGTVADMAGLSLEQTTGALALFADQGLRGSDAGTSLKTALTAMLAPSETAASKMRELGISFRDAQGNFVGLAGAASELQRTLGPLAQAQRDAALQAIFGQDAIRVGSILYNEGAAAVNEYTVAVSQSGTAQAVAAANMQGFNGALEQLQGAVQNAAIAFGAALAPAIEAAAGVLGGAAQAFARLPPALQQAAAGIAAVVGGFALAAAGIAKVAGIAIETIARFKELNETLRLTGLLMSALSSGIGPVALALTALAAITVAIIAQHRAHEQAVRDLEKSYADLQVAIEQFKLAGQAKEAEDLARASQAVADANAEIGKTLAELQDGADAYGEALKTASDINKINELHRAMSAIEDEQNRLRGSAQQWQDANEQINAAMHQQGVDTTKLADFIERLARSYAEGAISAEQFFGAIADLPKHLSDFAQATGEATDEAAKQAAVLGEWQRAVKAIADAFGDVAQPQKAGLAGFRDWLEAVVAAGTKAEDDLKKKTRDMAAGVGAALKDLFPAEESRNAVEWFQQIADAADAFNRSLADTVTAAANTIAGLEDVVPFLDGMQEGFGRAGDSALDLAAKLDDAGAIDLADAERQAVDLARALEDVEAQGVALDAAIQNNQDDFAMWAGRVKLVTDVLGGNTEQLDDWIGKVQDGTMSHEEFTAAVSDPSFTDTFDKLDALYDSGAISIATYNKAKQAGIDILARSSGAMQDENEELVGNLIALDAYIQKHDEADGAVNALSDAQRGFLVALQSTAGQLALQTINLAAYLAMMGLIPKKKVTEIAAELGAADPAVKALLEDLGLIPDEKHTVLTAEDEASAKVDLVKSGIEAVPATKTVKMDLDFAATGDGTELLSGAGLAAFEKTIPVKTKLEPPDTSAVDAAVVPAKDVPTKLAAPDAAAVAAYHPEAITIPTHLGAPLTDLVDNFTPPTVTIPTELGTPTGSPFGAGAGGVAALTIPTVLGAPDATAVTDYVPPTVTTPTVLGTPDTTALDTFAAATYTTTLDADDTDATNALNVMVEALDNYEQTAFVATLDADAGPAQGVLDAIVAAAAAWGASSYAATLAADASGAIGVIGEAISAANAFERTYTATLTANIQPALDSLGTLANHLPHSPAKEGPLSKAPSFDYVVEAFVAAMDEIARLGKQATGDLGTKVRASLTAETATAVAAARGGLAAVPAAGGFVDARTFVALKSDDYQRLLAGAEMGGGAYRWIRARDRAFATVGG